VPIAPDCLSGLRHWWTFEVGICLWTSLRTFLVPSGILVSDELGPLQCVLEFLDIRTEAHIDGLDHICCTLGIEMLTEVSHWPMNPASTSTLLFSMRLNTFIHDLYSTHCSWTYIKLCYRDAKTPKTPNPSDLIDLVHAMYVVTCPGNLRPFAFAGFVKWLLSLNLNVQHKGACASPLLGESTELPPTEELQLRCSSKESVRVHHSGLRHEAFVTGFQGHDQPFVMKWKASPISKGMSWQTPDSRILDLTGFTV